MPDKSRPLPLPRVRRGIIVASFILLIIWIAVFVIYAYHDPEVLCGRNNMINIFTFIVMGTSIFGAMIYLVSPDSQLKLKSWIRRVPMFWNYLLDSSYTPYFDPDYFILKNGRYVKITNNMIASDDMGLPIVDPLTPLNSFNMNIYRKYNKPILDKITQWMNATFLSPDNTRHILNKFIIERSRIVVVGDTCMIVKSWSGEHLLIHKSKYVDFIEDQRKTTRMLEIDTLRVRDLTTQLDRITGLKYFAEKLNGENPNEQNMAQKALHSHYKPLVNEISVLYACYASYPEINKEIAGVIRNVITDEQVSYSFKTVLRKFMDLSLANLVKFNFDYKKVQTELLIANNNSVSVLEGIFITQMNGSKYQSLIKTQMNYQSTILKKLYDIVDNPVTIYPVLKSISPACAFDTNIKIIPRYAPPNLRTYIRTYVSTYNQKHSIKSYIGDLFKKSGPSEADLLTTSITGPVLEEEVELPEKPLDPSMVQLVSIATDSSISDNINNTSNLTLTADNFTKLELAKAEQTETDINNLLTTMKQQLDALERSVKEMPNNPTLNKLFNEHRSNTKDVEEKAQLITDQRIELQMAIRDNARLSADAVKRLKELTDLKKEAREKTAMFQANEKQVRDLEMQLRKRDSEFGQYKNQLMNIQQKQSDVISQYETRHSEDKTAYQNQIDNLHNLQQQKQRELEELRKSQQINDSKYEEEQKKLNAYYKEQNDKAKKSYDDYIARQEQIYKSKIAEMDDNQRKLSASITQISSDKEKLAAEMASKSDALAQTTQKLTNLTEEFEQMNAASQKLLADVAQKAAQIETFERKNKNILKQKMIQKLQHVVANNKLSENLEEYKKKIDQKDNELSAAQQAISAARQKEQELGNKVNMVRQKKAEMLLRNTIIRKQAEKEKQEKDKALQQLSATNKQSAQVYNNFLNDLNAKQFANDSLWAQLTQAQQRYSALELSKQALDEKNEEEKAKAEQSIKDAQESALSSIRAIEAQIENKDLEIATLKETLQSTKQKFQNETADVAAKLEKVSNSELEVLRLQEQLKMAAEQEQKYLKDKTNAELEKQAIIRQNNELVAERKTVEAQIAKAIELASENYKAELNKTKAKAEKYKQQSIQQMEQSQITSQNLAAILKNITSIMLDRLTGNKLIEVNEALIDELNKQMNYYFNLSTSNSKTIETNATQFYPIGSPQTEIEGKILNYVYSMWVLIGKHPQISSALQSIDENPDLARSKFIESCNKFIKLGYKIFDDPNNLESIVNARNISNNGVRGKDIKNFLHTNRITKISPAPPTEAKQKNSPNVPRTETQNATQSKRIELTIDIARDIFNKEKLNELVLRTDKKSISFIKTLTSINPPIANPLQDLIKVLNQDSSKNIIDPLNNLIEAINKHLVKDENYLTYYEKPQVRNAW